MTDNAAWRLERLDDSHLNMVVAIHRQAFAGKPHLALGDAYLKAMLRWYSSDRRAIALVALTLDGTVVGYVVGANGEGEAAVAKRLRWAAAIGLLRRPWMFGRRDVRDAVLRRLHHRGHVSHDDRARSDYFLVGIGVDSGCSGRGVGMRLMREFEVLATATGARQLSLSVYPGNERAIRLYTRAGWRAADGSPEASYGTATFTKPVRSGEPNL